MKIPSILQQGKWWWIDGTKWDDVWDESNGDTNLPNFVIDSLDYRIERKDATNLIITLRKNTTGMDRELIISLEAGDYFGGITLTQEK